MGAILHVLIRTCLFAFLLLPFDVSIPFPFSYNTFSFLKLFYFISLALSVRDAHYRVIECCDEEDRLRDEWPWWLAQAWTCAVCQPSIRPFVLRMMMAGPVCRRYSVENRPLIIVSCRFRRETVEVWIPGVYYFILFLLLFFFSHSFMTN